MQRNQVSIFVERFGPEAPEGAWRQQISAYADADNVWEALAAAAKAVTDQILKDQPLPCFGRADADSCFCRSTPWSPDADFEAQCLERDQRLRKEFREQGNTKPGFRSETGEWMVPTGGGRTEHGGPLYVASRFTGGKLCYRYDGYGSYSECSRRCQAFDLKTVVKTMLENPESTNVEDYTEDYSPKELLFLWTLKERLLAKEEKA